MSHKEEEIEQQLRSVEAAYRANVTEDIITHFTDDARMLIPGIDVAGGDFRRFIADVGQTLRMQRFDCTRLSAGSTVMSPTRRVDSTRPSNETVRSYPSSVFTSCAGNSQAMASGASLAG